MEWPKKDKREKLEIHGFIEAYALLPEPRKFQVVIKRDKPDYFVRDVATDEEFGVELTSAYMDNRSVPDVHMREEEGFVDTPYNKEVLKQYKKILIGKIIEKICKARKSYDTKRPLILAIYVNEYISIYLSNSELEAFVQRYEGVFDSMAPFSEIVFWKWGNVDAFRVMLE